MNIRMMKFCKCAKTTLLAMAVVASVAAFPAIAQAEGLGVASHSKADVVNYMKSNGVQLTERVTYAAEPSLTQPFSKGTLSAETATSALKVLNNVRYIAGLQPVSYATANASSQQACSLVNALNGKIDHYPSQPNGLDDATYQEGYAAASKSNLAWNNATLNMAIVHGWMDDSDASNIDRVGHRRWCLNPAMGATAFGVVGRFYSMYALDRTNSSANETNVSWPGQQMPLEYFGNDYAWSLSTGTTVSASNVRVVMKRVSDGATWSFSSTSADGDFYVNNGGYGQSGCIIFRPSSISYAVGDKFEVTITGATSSTISYTVEFFSLDAEWHQHNYKKSFVLSADKTVATETAKCACGDTKTYTHPVSLSYSREATCTERGQESYTFYDSDGGRNSQIFFIEALGHNMGTGSVSDGILSGTCTRCGASFNTGVITSFVMGFNKTGENSYSLSASPSNALRPEESMWVMHQEDNHGTVNGRYDWNFTVVSSDESVASVSTVNLNVSKITAVGPGAATITVYPTLNPSAAKSFQVYVSSLEGATVSVGSGGTYDGTAHKPTVTVRYGGVTLTEGEEYAVDYENNINAGTASATVRGINGFRGSVTKTFTISRASLLNAVVTVPNAEYAGAAATPTPTVTLNGKTLAKDTDYTVSYSNNTAIGTSARATISGTGNYTGTRSVSFSITRPTLVDEDVSVADGGVYNGSAQTPNVTVSHAGKTLVKGTDYTVSYSNNVNAGTAKVTVKGMGNYAGTCEAAFAIAPLTVTAKSLNIEVSDTVYTGSVAAPQVKVSRNGVSLVAGRDYVASTSSVSAGAGVVDFAFQGNYASDGAISSGFTIKPAKLTAKYAGESIKCNETPKGVVTVTGFVGGETADTAAGYRAPAVNLDGATVGTRSIAPSGGSAANYEFEYVAGSFAMSHANVVTDAAQEATCTEDGKTEGSHCSGCNEVIVKQTVRPALGHDEKTLAAVAPTCTKTGLSEGKVCARCHEVLVAQSTVEALPHDYVTLDAKDPTCTEDGWYAYDGCSRCDYGNKVVRQALGHDVVADEAVAATCTQSGLTAGEHCGRCNKVITAQKTVAALGHDWGEWIVTQQAGVGVPGQKVRMCAVCEKSETAEIPALPTEAEQQAAAEKAEAAANAEAIAAGFMGTTATVEKSITGAVSDEGPAGTTFAMLQAKVKKATTSSIQLNWTRVSSAKTYVVYGNKCGKTTKYQKLSTVTGTTFKNSRLKKGTYYKYLVMAVDSKGRVITTSKTIHAATKGGKVGNHKSVTTAAKKNKVSLKKGKSFSLKAKAVAESSKLKVKKHRAIKFETANASIATVSSKGVIKAKGKGTCYVFAYAQNGVFAKVKVTIK